MTPGKWFDGGVRGSCFATVSRGADRGDGVRPDPAFANVISVVSDGEIIRHEFYVNFTASLFTPSPAASRMSRRPSLASG